MKPGRIARPVLLYDGAQEGHTACPTKRGNVAEMRLRVAPDTDLRDECDRGDDSDHGHGRQRQHRVEDGDEYRHHGGQPFHYRNSSRTLSRSSRGALLIRRSDRSDFNSLTRRWI